jgi:poly(glycerol-phosphate) alpha-glucosyltransferase
MDSGEAQSRRHQTSEQTMKAAYVVSSLSRRGGGVTEVARQLAQQLHAQSKLQVEAFGLFDDYTDQDIAAWDPVAASACGVLGPRALGYSPTLLGCMRNARPDILHHHGLWMYTSLASFRLASASVREIISPHGMLDPWALRNSVWKKRIVGALFEQSHLRAAHCIHALCAPELEAVRAFGLSNPVCVIPNGISLPHHQATDDGGAFDPRTERRIVLYLGRIHPKKGLHTLLDAWANAMQRCPRVAQAWTLCIAGWEAQSGYERELRAQASALSIAENVTFLGPLFGRDKVTALRNAAAFVLASVSEGMPMAVLEAWAYHLPVIMTRECNLTEGFAVEAALEADSSAQSLADALIKLFSMTDSERAQMGMRGRRLVESKYTWENAAGQLRSVYEWLLGASRPACVVLAQPPRHFA